MLTALPTASIKTGSLVRLWTAVPVFDNPGQSLIQSAKYLLSWFRIGIYLQCPPRKEPQDTRFATSPTRPSCSQLRDGTQHIAHDDNLYRQNFTGIQGQALRWFRSYLIILLQLYSLCTGYLLSSVSVTQYYYLPIRPKMI